MRDLVITIYLSFIKIIFSVFKLFPVKDKVTFLISFVDNPMYIYKMLKRKNIPYKVVFLCEGQVIHHFSKNGELCYSVKSLIGLFHLATSKQVIADNYFGILASTEFRKNVTVTQIWHSAGAIKQFGAMDPTNGNRSDRANYRFKKVYDRFTHFAVGSDFMADIFKLAFLADNKKFLDSGIPRTDFFFDKGQHAEIISNLYKSNTNLINKKIILYAPTFRRYEHPDESFKLDIKKMYEALAGEYILIVKFHPKLNLNIELEDTYKNFIFNYSNYPNINDLLLITDILITDYSSIPMEYCLLNRKMIFFAYDVDEYKLDNGLWEDFETAVPGPVVKTNDELIEEIQNPEIDYSQIAEFKDKWVAYCDGNSSEKLIKDLFA